MSRFLVSLGASGLPVTLALNKADLLPAAEIQVCVLGGVRCLCHGVCVWTKMHAGCLYALTFSS